MNKQVYIAIIDNRLDNALVRQQAIDAKTDWPALVATKVFTNADDLIDAFERRGEFYDIIYTDVYMPRRGDDPSGVGTPEEGAIKIKEWLRGKREADDEYKSIQLRWVSRFSDVSSFIHKHLNFDNYSWLHWLTHHEKGTFLAVDFLRDVEIAIRMVDPWRADNEAPSDFIFESPAMKEVLELVEQVAASPSSVLLTGESGTGKEVVAQSIHQLSDRRAQPFVSINCGAVPETLLESELFGTSKGAFTGAVDKAGLFESAGGGTILLDEIGETTQATQVKLLRVLQERRIRRVGGNAEKEVKARVIAATNRDLQAEIARGNFREDLYYRLAVFPIEVPPLRERVEDIRPMAESFLRKYALRDNKGALTFSPEVFALLERYDWPGNVRQLASACEYAAVRAPLNGSIGPELLHPDLRSRLDGGDSPPPLTVEEQKIYRALKDSSFNVAKAAAVLGVTRQNLHKILNGPDAAVRHPTLHQLYKEGHSVLRLRGNTSLESQVRRPPAVTVSVED